MRSEKTKNLILCAMFAVLIAVGAFIRVPVPLVPFTMQYFFTMLAGLLLGPKNGCIAVCVYIFVGLAGLPVFAQGGGPGYIFQPTFGYLIGFVLGTYLTGTIAGRCRAPGTGRLLCADFAGLIAVYLVGTVYYALICELYLGTAMGIKTLLVYCVLLPIPGDILLCILCAVVGKRVIPRLKKGGMIL